MFSKLLQLIFIGVIGSAILVGSVACGSAGNSPDDTLSDGGIVQGEDGSVIQASDSSKEFEGFADEQGAPVSSDAAQNQVGGAAPGDPQLQALLDRKIVQTTTVDVGVEDVARTFTDIIASAEAAGGFVSTSVFSNNDDEQSADLTIRVPADQYQSVLAIVRRSGDVSNEASDARDVTEEYTDLQARLRTLEATEQRYLELLAKAGNINDILTVQDRLDGVRGQIEQALGRIELLDHLTDLATITVHLRSIVAADSGGGGTGPMEAAQEAWDASLATLGGLAIVGLVVVAFSWWLVPPVIVAAIATRWWRNKRSRAAEGAA